jgi:fido (protein-threonine AMPylation protein)
MDLRSGTLDTRAAASDTRGVHARLFTGLTPPDQLYYAGHYRGEAFRCLRRYQNIIGSRLGWKPSEVPWMMEIFKRSVTAAVGALDAGNAQPNSIASPEIKLLHTVQVACRFFELLCRIHPYANGNGHAARFCVWAILVRFGYYPVRWPIDPRPPDPPYTQLLQDYRAGKRDGLEQHVLKCCLF